MFFPALRASLVALGSYTIGVLAVASVFTVTHDLPPAYDFFRSDTGDYSIKLPNPSIHVDIGGTPKDFYVDVEDLANTNLPRDLAASHPLHEPVFQSCTPVQKNSLLRAVGSSRRYIATTISYLQTPGPKPAYRRWFGVYNAARASTVERVSTNLRGNDLSDFTFTCDCTDPDIIVRLDITRKILHLCSYFWEFPADGVDESQAIFITAAAARLEQNDPPDIIADGRDASIELARSDPAAAVRNIDSYLEFIVTVANLTITPEDDSE